MADGVMGFQRYWQDQVIWNCLVPGSSGVYNLEGIPRQSLKTLAWHSVSEQQRLVEEPTMVV
jgi:hypothetical protein